MLEVIELIVLGESLVQYLEFKIPFIKQECVICLTMSYVQDYR